MPKIRIPAISIICIVGFIFIEPTMYLLSIFLSIFLHEAGHIAVLAILGIGIERVTVLPMGIDIRRREGYISYPGQILLDLAGITVNLAVFFAFRSCGFFAYANLLYAAINLLPVKGLDGGNALEAFLLCFLPLDTADRIIKMFSVVFCILLWMLGIYILLILNGNISIFALSVFLFVTVIMK